MRKLYLFLALLCPSVLFAQGSQYSAILLGPTGRPLAGAQITVCSFGSTGVPCQNPINLFSDPGLSQPINNPTTSDSLGNWGFWALPNNYVYTVTGVGITQSGPFMISVPCNLSSACSGTTSTFANLPVSPVTNALAIVTDGNGNNCLGGGGTIRELCQWTGTAWVLISSPITASFPITAANGGTGTATPTAHGVAIAEGAGTPFNFANPTNNAQCFMSAASNFSITDPSFQTCPGAGGGGSPSAGSQGVIQGAGSVAGTFQVSGLSEPPGTGVLNNNDTDANRGPNLGVDITNSNFKARAVNPNTIPLTTGTITTGTNSLVVASNSGWQIGDGLVGIGMGATNCATPPAAPTAFAALASSSTGTGWMVAGGAGSTSVSYSIVALSQGTCYTAASPVVTVANSNDAMGQKTLAVTSQAIGAGTSTVTVTVGSTTGLASGFWGLIDGTSDNQEFGGYHHFTVVDGTHLSYTGNINSLYFMNSSSASGGTLYYKAGNHLTFPTLPAGTNIWQYAVYRCIGASCALPANAANYSLVYMSYPANLGYTDATYNQWDDFGTTMTPALTPKFNSPWFLPTTPPATNVNDALVAQVTGIAGTTFTLSTNALNSASGASVRFGNDYAISTAVAALPKTVTGGGGSVHFPPAVENPALDNFCYVTSGYLSLSGGVFNQGAPVCAGYTLDLTANWNGTTEDSGRMSRPGFSMQSEILLRCDGANPCIWRRGASVRNVTIQGAGPGEMLVFESGNGSGETVTENVNFATDLGSSDYMSILYYSYVSPVGGGFGGTFNNTSYSVGPVQTIGATDTPLFISKNNSEWHFNYMSLDRRGFYFECSSPSGFCAFYETMKMGQESQGPITPLVTFNAAQSGNTQGLIYLEHLFQDSAEMPMVVEANTVGTIGAPMFINQINSPGNNMPIISGDFFNGGVALSTSTPLKNNQAGMNHDLTQCTGQENIGPVSTQGYAGCSLPALALATASYGVNHTLTGSEGIVKATVSGITFTLPHALPGQTWEILNPSSGTITLTIDSGTLSGNGATGNITIPANQGVLASCDGTNCSALGLGGGSGGSPGGLTNALQSNGGGPSFQGTNAPTSPGIYSVIYNTPSTSSVAPTIVLPGVPVNPQTGTTYTIGAANYWNDRATIIRANNAGAQTYTMVNPSAAGFGFNMPYTIHNVGAGTITENASGFTINGTTSLVIPPNWVAPHWSDGVNWFAARYPSYEAFPSNCTTAVTVVAGVFGCGGAGSVSGITGDGGLFCNSGSTGAVTLVPCTTTLAHKFWGNNTGSTGTAGFVSLGEADLPATTVFTDKANTYGAFKQDFSAGSLVFPSAGGATASATNTCVLDTTNKNIHCYINNADAIVGGFASAPTTGHLVSETVASGNVLLTDSGVVTATAAIAIPNTVLANRRNCSQDAGADDGLKLQACLIALNSANSQAGIADATGLTGLTWSVNPFAAASLPASGEIWLPPGDTVTSVPTVMPDAWVIKGIGGRSVAGQYGSNLKASASWPPTYSTGTITKGTAGANDVITGSGTTWNSTNTPIGCAFVGGTQPNVTYGIISAIGSTTSITLKWGTDNGTGAAAASAYNVFCPVVVMGGGGASAAGAQFGIQLLHMGVDCNNIAGCVDVLNWYAQQHSEIHDTSFRGFTNIGLLVEGQPQNSGPYDNINFSPGTSCTANTIPLVIRAASQSLGQFHRISASKGPCATTLTVGIDLQGSFTELNTIDVEQVTTGISIGANTSCPVTCANPAQLASQFHIVNAYNPSGSGTTVVAVSNFKGTPTDYSLTNIQGNVPNTFTDAQNSCTETVNKLGSYIVDHAGAINESTSTTSGCATVYTKNIASGTAAMGTSAISSGACATVVTVAGTGIATTDVITLGFNGDPTAVTGYGASATGAVLTIYPYLTSGNANFKVCNSSSGSITPGALTLNWKVVR